MKKKPPKVRVTVEIPRGSFVKRGSDGQVDFISPFPCPFNYGAVATHVGDDGDLLDAVVLGPRLKRGDGLTTTVRGAVGFVDRGIWDAKLICSPSAPDERARRWILLFFRLYAQGKRLLNLWRGLQGQTACLGWVDAERVLAAAKRRNREPSQ